MEFETLQEEIAYLIGLAAEGEYWDYKEKWHENNADLLHDIICMANNLVDRDAYLIIGVTDSKSPGGVQIKGVPEANRKNQQNVIDLLRSAQFAGSIRPTVYVQTIQLSKTIDVVIIKNSDHTPFYLSAPYPCGKKCVQSGHIYARVGDTNTPKKNCADIDKVEYLWKKRFGIDLTIKQRLLRLLDDPDAWVGDLGAGKHKYHSVYPEFQILINECDDSWMSREHNSILLNLGDHFPDISVNVCTIEIRYHSTVLFSDTGVYLDGGRHLIPFPDSHTITIGSPSIFENVQKGLTYVYQDLSTVSGKMFHCLCTAENNWYGEKWWRNTGREFLLFDDPVDRKRFDEYARSYLDQVRQEYNEALTKKGYVDNDKYHEYFVGGWSKANEIKAWFLYEHYRGTAYRDIEDYIPNRF